MSVIGLEFISLYVANGNIDIKKSMSSGQTMFVLCSYYLHNNATVDIR